MDRLLLFETFVAIVDAESLSGAARRLGCSLSAISRRLDELETSLGCRLFDRTSRSLRLTEAADRLLPRAQAVLRAMEKANASVAQGPASSATVRVSVPVHLGLLHLIPSLPPLLAAHPSLRLEVLLDNRVVPLERDGIDVVVRAGLIRPPESSDLVARLLGRYRFVLCATPAFLARHGEPERPEDLAGAPMIAHVSLRGRAIPFRREREEVAVTLSPVLFTNDMMAAHRAACSGIGIAALPQALAKQDLASGALKAVLSDWATPTGEAWIAYRRHGRANSGVRLVVAHVAAALRV